jgi:dTDP-4-dehydrorhamnose 3,5-epimerase
MEKPFLTKSLVLVDDRGTFSPTPTKFSHKFHLLLRKEWVQTNLSINVKPYTFRGLHYQDPYPQTKLIKVIQGTIIDFVVNLELGPEFGKTDKFTMEPGDMLYVPKGYGHGFITMEPNTVVQYMVDEDYYPQYEGSVSWKSVPEVFDAMKQFECELVISEKDVNAKTIDKYRIEKKPSLDQLFREYKPFSQKEEWDLTIVDKKGNDLIVMAPNGDTQYMTKGEYESYKIKRKENDRSN